MIGWMIAVHRKTGWKGRPASASSSLGALVAQWQGAPAAIDWLRDLAHTDDAVDLGGNGYPMRITAKAGAVLPVVEAGPPFENKQWQADPADVLTDQWVGHTVFNTEVARACASDEWLIVEIWDES